MRSMIIGCALLLAGSCAALAQQDPTPAQGGSPNAPAPAAPAVTTPSTPAPAVNNPSDMKPMGKMAMHGGHHRTMMHHKKTKMHHRHMSMHKKMMHPGMDPTRNHYRHR